MSKNNGNASIAVIKPWLSVAEAAAYCSLSNWTIKDAMRRRQIDYCKVGKRVILNTNDLDRWLDAQRVSQRGKECRNE